MNPSRELDALVAEKVMGWKWTGNKAVKCRFLTKDGDVEYEEQWDLGDGWDYGIPHYSTDIAAAWEVVEKFSWYINIFSGVCFTVKIKLKPPCGGSLFEALSQPEFTADADTAPMAICLAALKACGVEV